MLGKWLLHLVHLLLSPMALDLDYPWVQEAFLLVREVSGYLYHHKHMQVRLAQVLSLFLPSIKND